MSDNSLLCARDDTVSGGFLLLIGGVAMAMAISKYPLGNASQIGLGYVSVLLGGLLTLLGFLIALRGTLSNVWKTDKFHPIVRPLFFILGVIILFGYIIKLSESDYFQRIVYCGCCTGYARNTKQINYYSCGYYGLAIRYFFVKILSIPFKDWPL
ncbi:MAG: hypothetical protein ACSLEN_01635 [Candidatus Malihini olakiniferum]